MKFIHTADTHLGFEFTKMNQSHPEGRKRRADAIFRNFETVVQYAVDAEADLFIHSGDLFNKYDVPREVIDELVQPLVALAHTGVRVLVLPGNHERSEFPFDLFQGTRGIYVFDRPKSICLDIGGYCVGFAGFPFIPHDSGRTFLRVLSDTGYQDLKTDMNVLVTHQAFDQAMVGPRGFVFRAGRPDTVSRERVPPDFDYVAAGHIHRYQILPHPLKPDCSFVYPGSTQRMSFAEKDEDKGFIEGEDLNNRIETRFIPLPAFDMETVELQAAGLTRAECERAILNQAWRFQEDLVIRFHLTGGKKLRDYAEPDYDKIRSKMPPALECQFAVRTTSRWVMR